MAHKNYLTQNSKIAAMSGARTFNWGIPAYKSVTGQITCPWAKDCIKGCYARQGAYVWGNVAQAYEVRLALSKAPSFVPIISAEIRRRKIERLRIHDSGDFYSVAYRDAWFEIMRENPTVSFYAYTKAFPLFDGVELPANFTLIRSEGGKIAPDTSKRHSRVFPDAGSLKRSGYADASKDDAKALGRNHRVGLIYHGHKGRAWTTNESKGVSV